MVPGREGAPLGFVGEIMTEEKKLSAELADIRARAKNRTFSAWDPMAPNDRDALLDMVDGLHVGMRGKQAVINDLRVQLAAEETRCTVECGNRDYTIDVLREKLAEAQNSRAPFVVLAQQSAVHLSRAIEAEQRAEAADARVKELEALVSKYKPFYDDYYD